MKNSSSSSAMWQPIGSSSSASGAFHNQVSPSEISEEDLERQYAAYKAQFEEWIDKNRNHPDRDAYNRYVNQFKEWEAQVDANRRAIREWKARQEQRESHAAQSATTSKFQNNGATGNSETSSPPLSSTSGGKKKKKKPKKKKEKGDVGATGGEENPMMAMMKMMAATMTTNAPAPAPAVPTPPMDPFSMMMAMTMMMPMMMNAAPAPPPTAQQNTESTKPKPASSLPDVSKPPPGFRSEDERPRPRYEQAERDRAFRGDRSYRHQERTFTPNFDRSPPRYGGERMDAGLRRQHEEREEPGMRGDFYYQRWLANRQHHPVSAGGPPAPAAIDPWISDRPSANPHPYPPHHLQSAPLPGPVPLLPPFGAPPHGMSLDRDHYPPVDAPPYVSRSHFGARDFSMRKQPQQRSRWD